MIPEHTHCINCGLCCGPIMVTKREEAEIKQYIAKLPKAEIKRMRRQKRERFTCQFRDEENRKCAIYPVRPEICRLFGVVEGMECVNGNTMELDGGDLVDMRVPRKLVSVVW